MNLRKFRTSSMIVLGLVTALVVGGCSDGYDSPETAENAAVKGAATNVLVEPATVKSWMDQGLVNSEDPMKQRVVIIDFGADPSADPLPKHIKGACLVGTSALTGTRPDGLAPHTPMVATGEQMDTVAQTFGIDDDTVIVFTTSGSPYLATRAYWTFRYWGFPKEQLKLLNGGNSGFAAAHPELMTTESTGEATPSTFSVRDLPGVQADLRASMGEMIEIFKGLTSADSNDIVIDARGSGAYSGNGNTPALIAPGSVVVDGHPEGGKYLSYTALFSDYDSDAKKFTKGGVFKDAEAIRGLFADEGWEPGKKVTVYCTSAYSATPLFFALDAILDTPVQLHDGSWSQTGLYSDYARMGGQLPVGSPWAIDKYLAFKDIDYNLGDPAPLKIEPLIEPLVAENQPTPFVADDPATLDIDESDVPGDADVNPLANQVEVADAVAVDNGTEDDVTFISATSTEMATATDGVLIDPETLEAWKQAGLLDVAVGSGSERVVLLDVATATKVEDGETILGSYAKGHIPGAQLWDVSPTAGHVQHRLEGPAKAVNMVVDAERMNTLLSKHGIDENTTIVITSSLTTTYYPSRAYFLLRYYGWPKEQIKVLNGYNGAWPSSDLVKGEPAAVTPSELTVQKIGNLQPDLRVSLPELMDAIRDGRGMAVDFRGNKAATGSTPGVVDNDHDGDGKPDADYVAFEGLLNSSDAFNWLEFNVAPGKGDLRFKSRAEIKNALNTAGISNTDGPIYSYCRTGYIASTGFFVLDAILDTPEESWDVMAYDGSWSQWGKLSADITKGGELPAGSPWAVDNADYMSVVNYNVDNKVKVAPLNPDSALLNVAPSDPAANQVESEDNTYQQQASGNEGGGAPTQTQPGPAIGC